MKAEKDISTLKLLGITILMTVSSCVSASAELSPKQFNALAFNLELALNGKADVAKKPHRATSNNNRHSRLNNLIKSGRENIAVKKLQIDHTPFSVQIKHSNFELPLLNSLVLKYKSHSKESFILNSCPTRAGPLA